MPPTEQPAIMNRGVKILLETLFVFVLVVTALWLIFNEEIKCNLMKDVYVCVDIGNKNFTDENYHPKKAQKYYLNALEIGGLTSPVSYNLHYQLGRTYFIDNMLLFALYYFDLALAENPKFLQAIYMRGLANSYLGRFEKAEADFKSYLALNPSLWAALNDLSWVYFRQGKFIQSEEAALQGLSYEPGNPWLNNAVGIALINLGEPSKALPFFEKALIGFETMSEEEWGTAYPGNGPFTREAGLAQAVESVKENIALVRDR